MRYFAYLIFGSALLVQGCSFDIFGFRSDKDQLNLTLQASPMINPRADSDAVPVFIRVYQLSDYFRFQQANFLDLYKNNADAALGNQLVFQEPPIPLLPGETLIIDMHIQPQSRYLGVLAQFNRYDESAHRLWIPLFEGQGKRRKVTIVVSGLNISLKK